MERWNRNVYFRTVVKKNGAFHKKSWENWLFYRKKWITAHTIYTKKSTLEKLRAEMLKGKA